MSNALSIAAVTGVIKYLLENGLVSDAIAASVGDVIVTALPPDRISVGSDERAQLNLFLYQVTQNRNVDWVSKEFSNRDSTNPPLALDLHYLLTAYGPKDFQGEILLGYAMQMLHKSQIITSEIIENSLKNASETSTSSVFSQALASVSVSDLAEEIGQIKISPEFFKMEETSKIWSALQTHYRPSASYLVSMVLIESETNQDNAVCMIPLSQPYIEQVIVPFQPEQPIISGSKIWIRGKRLRGDITKIRLGSTEKKLSSSDVQETQIIFTVPPDLFAGLQTIQIIHEAVDNARQMDRLIESNVAAFVLHPTVTASVIGIQVRDNSLCSAEISLKLSPVVDKLQRVILRLHRMSTEEPSTYAFLVAPRIENTDVIIVPVENIKLGKYLVAVQIDGAESPLYQNQSGEYDLPQVMIA
jgi:hypothetical protein